MDSLNTILNSGTYGENVSRHNDNNSKIKQAITTLENVAIANKGYFDTLASLQAAFPSPKAGNIAYVANVASSTGYYIYNVVSGVWTATSTEAPAVDVTISNYAQHGYSSSPKTLKQVEDEIVQLNYSSNELLFSVDDKYINDDGRIVSNIAYHCTDYMKVTEGDKLTITAFTLSPVLVVAGYDENKNFVQSLLNSGTYNGQEVTIPTLISYVVICGKKLVEGNIIDANGSIHTKISTDYIENMINETIDDRLTNFANLDFNIEGYYLNDDGRIVSNSVYHCTDYIPVNAGDVVTLTAYNGSPIIALGGFDASKNFVGVLLGTGTKLNEVVTIPDGVGFIVACGKKLAEGNTIDVSGTIKQEKYLTKSEKSFVRFRKTASNKFYIDVVNGKKTLSYEFTKYFKQFDNIEYTDGGGVVRTTSVVATNMWNNTGLYLDGTRIAEGNTNFISSVNGYVGNGHGCEVELYLSMSMNGKGFEIDNATSINGDIFQMVIKSNMYVRDLEQSTSTELAGNIPLLDENGEPVIMSQHNMEIRIDENDLSVDNTQRILRDNISFSECHGAMLEIDYGLFDKVWVNNDENTINEVGNSTFTPVSGSYVNLQNTHVHGNKVIMYGKDFSITQEMEVKLPLNMNPGIYFNDYTNSRLKAYFQPVPTSTRSGGQTAMVFNTGDIIRVNNKRTIDF